MEKPANQGEHSTHTESSYSRISVFFQKPLFHFLIISIVGILAYSNTFHVPFQWDEDAFMTDSPLIMNLHYYLEPSKAAGIAHYHAFISRYLTFLTFAVNYSIHGYEVAGYHIVNLAIHIMNGLLVYILVILLFRTPFLEESQLRGNSRYIALFAGLLFVSHPLQTMAVTYIYQRLASFVALFYILTVVLYIKSRLTGGKLRYVFYIAALLAAICAMKTKENAFTLPLTIILVEFFFFSDSIKRRAWRLTPLLLTMSIIPVTYLSLMTRHAGILRKLNAVTTTSRHLDRDTYFFTQLNVLVKYLRLFFFPTNQSIVYDMPLSHSFFEPKVIASFLLLSTVFALGVYLFFRSRKMKSLRLVSLGIFWFFINHAMESGLIPLVMIVQEYRMYLPSVGLVIGLSTALFLFFKKIKCRQSVVVITIIAVPLLLSAVTFARNAVWQSRVSLWADVVKKAPDNFIGYQNYGAALDGEGLTDKAKEYFDIGLKLKPNSADLHADLGHIFFKKGLLDKALEQYLFAIEHYPLNSKFQHDIALVYRAKGLYQESMAHLQESIRLNPFYANSYDQLGTLYGIKGQKGLAIEYLEKAVSLKPGYVQAHYNLGVAYLSYGMTDNAEEEFRTVLKLDPSFQKARDGISIINRLRARRLSILPRR
jgi:Tfp pilus assembly protein PilF